jgi:hypothetical protein
MSALVPSRPAHEFWESLFQDIQEYVENYAMDVAEIGAMSAGSGRIVERGESYDSGSELLPVLSHYPPKVGDPVLIGKSADGSEFILGAIARGEEFDPITHIGGNYAQGATTASTTSTVTYANAFSITFSTVPVGTYTVLVMASGIFKHSVANGNIDIRARVDTGTDYFGSVKSPSTSPTANAEMVLPVTDAISGVIQTGVLTVNVYLEYKCNTAGTASVRNANVAAWLVRTG